MTDPSPVPAAGPAIDELRAALPDPGVVLTDPDIMRGYQRDETDLCAFGVPLAVVRPRTTAEVVTAVRVAAAHRIPVVPQGARTGLAGGANAVDGALVISLTGMTEIREINPVDRLAVVQPGVLNAELRRAAAKHGLFYPPDPSSFEICTIGGNISTNAGGMCCVKYGVTTEYVLALEVVLADGEVLHCGRRSAKGVAGYDLTRLFVGAEGTLGIITEITLRLRPAADELRTLVGVFPTVAAAGAAVTAIMGAGLSPSLLELIDQVHLRAIEAYRPMGLNTDAHALLLVGADSGTRAADELDAVAALCRQAGADEVYVASDAVEAEALLQARRLAFPSMEHLAKRLFPDGDGRLILDDVAVPRSRQVELISGCARIGTEHGITVGMLGHVGDGNLHPIMAVDRADPSSVERGMRAFDDILEFTLALGGTCTGEHGVGLLKREWLAREIGPVGLRVHRAIKAALDPDGILNPGKVV